MSGIGYWSVAGLVVVLSLTFYAIYQLFIHPLAKFPGPPLAKLSYVALSKWILRGRWSHTVKELHERYGPVVRIGPNTLSFSSLPAARTIYGNKPLFLKNEMYDAFGGGSKYGPSGMFPERNPHVHEEVRHLFTPCFIEDELRRQESSVHKYVDLLVDRLGEHESAKDGVDINFWARSFVTDVISDLSFGEPFGSLETGVQHFWVAPLRGKFIISAIFECCRRYPFMESAYWNIYSRLGRAEAVELHNYSSSKIKSRLASPPRADYIDVINNAHTKVAPLDLQVLRANLYGLIIGAAETTSFVITAALYFLAKYPDTQNILYDELHSTSKTWESLTMEEVKKLPYLRAVVDEALRMLPPSPLGGMRTSPGIVVDDYDIPQGTEVFSSYISSSRSPSYFQHPDTFMPERWLDPENHDIKAASLAFSLGPRNCIGRPLALLKTRLAIMKIIYRFEVSLADDNFDLEEKSNHYGGPWITPPVMLKFRSRSRAENEKLI